MSLIDDYLAALETGDLDAMLELFAEDATVTSPLQGEMEPAPFYEDLFAETKLSETRVRHELEGDGCVAVHFDYRWVLADGSETTFECVDVFELDDAGRIAELRVVYDTAELGGIGQT